MSKQNIKRIQQAHKNITTELKEKTEKPSDQVDIEVYIRYIQSEEYKK